MPRFTPRPIVLGLAAALTLALPALAQGDWTAWPVETEDPDGGVTRAEAPGDEASPRVTVLSGVPVPDGDAETALQDALAAMWLDMNEVEGREEGEGRLVIWGDVEAEQGERRFAAAIEGEGDAARVTAFVATAEDFDAMGGAGLLGAAGTATAGAPKAAAEGEASETAAVEPRAEMGAQRPAAPPGGVPAPVVVDVDGASDIPGWTQTDEAWIGDPENPELIRFYGVRFDPGEVETPLDAMVGTMEFKEMTDIEAVEPTAIPTYQTMIGEPLWLGIGTARAGGSDQVVSVEILYDAEEDRFRTRAVQAPPEVFAGWGGASAILSSFGTIEPGFFDPETMAGFGEQDLDQQRQFLAQATESRWQGLMQQSLGTLMMQQQSTLGTMRQMNDNLAAETTCIVAGNCTMGYDGLGDAAPQYE